jgi:hypothetical protein
MSAPHPADLQRHANWLGLLRPDGLVFSPLALAQHGPIPRADAALRERFLDLVLPEGAAGPTLRDLDAALALAQHALRWPARFVQQGDLERWQVDLPELGATLRPDAALLHPEGLNLLLCWSPQDPDRASADPRWGASPQERALRLLSELQSGEHPDAARAHTALLAWPGGLRLLYAPRGQAPGALSFPLEALCAAEGAGALDALLHLLGTHGLFGSSELHLHRLLAQSRQQQEAVTRALAEQVEEALHRLVAGFDEANQRANGQLLRDLGGDEGRQHLYEGLITALLRMVFLLYAEDRELMPTADPLYAQHYAISALADQLAQDRLRHPQAMDRRFGAWSRLLALFRMVFRGARFGEVAMPAREGDLFDPARYPFLEGRALADQGWLQQQAEPPAVDDGVVEAVLTRLTHLKGHRLSYRSLDVEQIGSVYEALMGFSLEPDPARPGRHHLVSSQDRRKTGSHYTPRALTEPLVERCLHPLLYPPGQPSPSPEQILALRVCDPAMGSGAFLAAACRYLGDQLAAAWARTQTTPPEAARVDALTLARRAVVERCLYGVDKNPFAVQLARLSLWLITLDRALPFTFVDHALREGDAIAGLNLEAIKYFDLRPPTGARLPQQSLFDRDVFRSVEGAVRMRARLTRADGYGSKRLMLDDADQDVAHERALADLLLAAAMARNDSGKAPSEAQRQARVDALRAQIQPWYLRREPFDALPDAAARLLRALPLRPFHWPLEFPEVFDPASPNPGFDAILGNPPFGGKNTISASNGDMYIPLLQVLRPHAHGGADLCAHFFLRAAEVLRRGGVFGLIATNSVKQGNTRDTGLRHMTQAMDITLYRATTDLDWPVSGAAVVVDIVHGCKGAWGGACWLNDEPVGALNSDLQPGDEAQELFPLLANEELGFQGSVVLGAGFVLTPDEAQALIARDPRNGEIVKPYIGGQELNSNPRLEHERCVIDFGDRDLDEAERWPELLQIVREKVKPDRDKNNREARRKYWWRFGDRQPGLYAALQPLQRCLVCARVSKHLMFAFQPVGRVLSEAVVVFALERWSEFAVLQSVVHEAWARDAGLGSSLKNDHRYTPSTCFETFAFPRCGEAAWAAMEEAGRALYACRGEVMERRGEGMTAVWNRVMDEEEEGAEIVRLRSLKVAMDEAVLRAYGWGDVGVGDRGRCRGVRRRRRGGCCRCHWTRACGARRGRRGRRCGCCWRVRGGSGRRGSRSCGGRSWTRRVRRR